MPLKPNYRHERTQKARTRELKRQEKQQRREEKSAKRKSAVDDSGSIRDDTEVTHGDETPQADPH